MSTWNSITNLSAIGAVVLSIRVKISPGFPNFKIEIVQALRFLCNAFLIINTYQKRYSNNDL